ncbi:MAG: TIGR02594 family protein [Bacteroidetes bacterium]|nr:TIGR02594 family protein [Bacteroidota bacterium]
MSYLSVLKSAVLLCLPMSVFGQVALVGPSSNARFSSEGSLEGSRVNSVDMFTGQVSFSYPIAETEGKGNSGISFAINYRSHSSIDGVANRDNLENPTGVLGVGWSYTINSVRRDTKGTAVMADDDYFLEIGGNSYALQVVADDPVNKKLSLITKKGTAFRITYFYDELIDKWEVVGDQGVIFTFGGVDGYYMDCHVNGYYTDGENKKSKGNSIVWVVTTNDQFIPTAQVFNGSTRIQRQVAIQWSLYTIRDLFGNQTTFSYEIQEKQIGQSTGNLFTRYQNLSEIKDNRDNRLLITYGDKTSNELKLNQPGDLPVYFYQEPSNPRYISKFEVFSNNSVKRKTISCSYDFIGTGAKIKRVLVGLSEANYFNETNPSTVFSYGTVSNLADFCNLKTITTPLGEITTFTYTTKTFSSGQIINNAENEHRFPPASYPTDEYDMIEGENSVLYVKKQESAGGKLCLNLCEKVNGYFTTVLTTEFTGLIDRHWHTDFGDDQIYNISLFAGKNYYAIVYNYFWSIKQKRVIFITKNSNGLWSVQDFYNQGGDQDLIIGEQDQVDYTEHWENNNNHLKIAKGDDWFALVGENTGKTIIFELKNNQWTKFRADNNAAFAYNTYYRTGSDWIQNYEILANSPNGFGIYQVNNNAPDKIIYFYRDNSGSWKQNTTTAYHNVNEGTPFLIENSTTASVYGFPGNDHIYFYTYADKDNVIHQEEINVSSSYNSYSGRKFVFRDGMVVFTANEGKICEVFVKTGATFTVAMSEFFPHFFSIQPGPLFKLFWVDANNYFHKRQWNYATSSFVDSTSTILADTYAFAAGQGFLVNFQKVYRTDGGMNWPLIGEVSEYPFDLDFSEPSWTIPVKYPTLGFDNFFAYNLTDSPEASFPNENLPNRKRGNIVFIKDNSLIQVQVVGNFFKSLGKVFQTGTTVLNDSYTFDRAGKYQMTGSYTAIVASAVTISDGYKQITWSYEFDPEKGGFNSSYQQGYFYKTTVIPPTGGKTIHYFHTGRNDVHYLSSFPLPKSEWNGGYQYYDLLLGRPLKTEIYDSNNRLLESVTNYYTVNQPEVFGKKVDFVYMNQQKTKKGSAEIVTKYYWDTAEQSTGRPLFRLKKTELINSDQSILSTTLSYSYPAYSASWNINLLNLPVLQVNKNGEKYTRAQITLLANTGTGLMYPWKTYRFIGGEDQMPEFSGWEGAAEPSSVYWQKTREITGITPSGQVSETKNIEEKFISTQYTPDKEYPVASFTNASRNTLGLPSGVGRDASYAGFDSGVSASGSAENDFWGLYGTGINDLVLNGHTGKYAVKLAKKTTGRIFGPTRDFLPSDQNGKYIFSCWVKTETGYTDGSAALVLHSKADGDNNTVYPAAGLFSAPITNTSGKWKYFSVVADLGAIRGGVTSPLRLRAYVYNDHTTASVVVDDIRFMPFYSVSSVTVLDSVLTLPVAVLGNNQETSFLYYNNFLDAFSGTDPNGLIGGFTTGFNTLKKAGSTSYSSGDPHSALTVSAQNGGSFYNFNYDNTDWALMNFSRKSGTLYHNSATVAGDVTYTPSTISNAGIRFWLNRESAAYDVKLAVGDYSVRLNNGTWSLIQNSSGTVVSTASMVTAGKEWYLQVISNKLLFFADGRLTLNYLAPSSISGTLKITLTAGTVASIDNLLLVSKPVAAMKYYNASGNLIQTQVDNGGSLVVSGPIYDSANRPAIQPKPALYTGSLVPFGYKTDYATYNWVNNTISGTVLSSNPSDGGYPYFRTVYEQSPFSRALKAGLPGTEFQVGNGDRPEMKYQDDANIVQFNGDDETKYLISAAYKPEDGIYTYSAFDFSGKKIGDKVGPLKEFTSGYTFASNLTSAETGSKIIHNYRNQTISWTVSFNVVGTADENDTYSGEFKIGTTPGGGDIYTKQVSKTTGGGTFTGSYQATPGLDLYISYTVASHSGLRRFDITGSVNYIDGEFQQTKYEYNAKGQVTKVFTPNYFTPPTQGTPADSYIETYSYDNRGLLVSSTTKEKGTGRIAYDELGRLRFILQASGENYSGVLDQVKYFKYDVLNRIVEEGIVDSLDWNTVILQADNANFPVSSSKWKIKSFYDYDWNGTTWVLGVRGLLYRKLLNTNTDVLAEVDEQYGYDSLNRLVTKKEKVTRYSTTVTYQTGYTYNLLNQITRITYPSGHQVDYSYDEFGRLKTVGTPSDADYYALYTYNMLTGQLSQENQATYGVNKAVGYNYNSPGWLTGISGGYFNEALTYTTGRYGDNLGYKDGKIASVAFSYSGLSVTGTPGNYTVRYAYDKLGQLTAADYVSSNSYLAQGDLGVGSGLTAIYDLNSNILNASKGADPLVYFYQSGNSRLSTFSNSNSLTSWTNTFDNSGFLKTSSYDDGEGSPAVVDEYTFDAYSNLLGTAVKKSGGITLSTVQLSYESSGARVLKETTTGSTTKYRLYLNSADGTPLEIREKTGVNGTETIKHYIYGLNGVLALRQSSVDYFMQKDHLGSVRVVYNGQTGATVGVYEYAAFGEVLYSKLVGTAQTDFTYTGQEWDADLGLMNYKARLYDPQTRRFLSPDPLNQYASPYIYVGNNPISLVDPSGMNSTLTNQQQIDNDCRLDYFLQWQLNWEMYWAPSNATYGARARGENTTPFGIHKDMLAAHDRLMRSYNGEIVPEYIISTPALHTLRLVFPEHRTQQLPVAGLPDLQSTQVVSEKSNEVNASDWMKIALKESGVKEILSTSGEYENSPRIIEYFDATELSGLPGTLNWGWCSAFANWVMTNAGYSGTRSGRAESWATWGTVLTEPRYGCITLTLKDGQYHVGFYIGPGAKEGFISLYGGNQSNQVKTLDSYYKKTNVVNYYWPK